MGNSMLGPVRTFTFTLAVPVGTFGAGSGISTGGSGIASVGATGPCPATAVKVAETIALTSGVGSVERHAPNTNNSIAVDIKMMSKRIFDFSIFNSVIS
jgi:hypothetical protein